MGWGVLGCRPNTTGLRVAGGMPGKPKRIRGCYNNHASHYPKDVSCITFFLSYITSHESKVKMHFIVSFDCISCMEF